MLLLNVINEQSKLYAVCNDDFHEIQQEINCLEYDYNSVAPGTQEC